ncbi:hypothetical protein [Rhodococcus sp. OK302]|uniref:hypothetical protein n=1 Tax=Rhodococcus sp. OK302 TaxID=1882769 RepID=UPI000B9F2223|nr:hypothetical protein [Rhodococcus sp. OK302]OYD60873.1 hypothetical protein BDB13_5768 [Rhodococcus sp. OK302]
MAVITPLLLAGCSSDSPTAEPSASAAESTSVEANTGSGGCDAVSRYSGASLFGLEWLLAYKKDPSASDVTLRRCHYVHNTDNDDEHQPNLHIRLMTGDLAPAPSLVPDGAEMQRILLSLPESTDPGRGRCGPVGGQVNNFDEYTVIDQYGVSVAKFQTSEYGSCGVRNVIPRALIPPA